jgi:phosphoribosylaminoimidazole-succinocarboxamide synthase
MTVQETHIETLKLFKRGKVRDVYELGQHLLFVATDRISCFDVVLPTPIPEKGKILTQISLFWFSFLGPLIGNHIVSTDLTALGPALAGYSETLKDRFMVVKKCSVIPFECVVRGYLSGSAWKEYQKTGMVCGIRLPSGLRESDKLPQAIFTPATKAEVGHDENVDFAFMESRIGRKLAATVRDISLTLYAEAARYAQERGILIADTKFEFGRDGDALVLVDEVFTPDSSRFWPKEQFVPGGPQVSFDKQFVRDYLESLGWDKTPPAPQLPSDVVAKTLAKYREAFIALTR